VQRLPKIQSYFRLAKKVHADDFRLKDRHDDPEKRKVDKISKILFLYDLNSQVQDYNLTSQSIKYIIIYTNLLKNSYLCIDPARKERFC